MSHQGRTIEGNFTYASVRTREPKTVCTCDLQGPEEDEFFTIEAQQTLALDYLSLRQSNPGRVRWVENELFLYHAGDLLDFDGRVIQLDQTVGYDEEDGSAISLFDQALSKCSASAMKRLIARASGSHRNAFDDEPMLRLRHLIFDLAMQVHRCRTIGRCSD